MQCPKNNTDQLDWVVVVCAGIVNIRNEWPLSNNDLYEYALNKYGDNLNNVHHHETTEIKDSKGRIILESGRVVNKEFKISYFDNGEVKTNDLDNFQIIYSNLQVTTDIQ